VAGWRAWFTNAGAQRRDLLLYQDVAPLLGEGQQVVAILGVSTAFWTLGEGRAFVEMPTIPASHTQMESPCSALVRGARITTHDRQRVLIDSTAASGSLSATLAITLFFLEHLELPRQELEGLLISELTDDVPVRENPRKLLRLFPRH